MGTWRSQRGVSIIEATVMLAVMVTLGSVLAPSIADYTNDAKQTVAKKDVEAIGAGILQLLRDTGSRCLRLVGTTECTTTNRVDLLVSGGSDPATASAADVSGFDNDTAPGRERSARFRSPVARGRAISAGPDLRVALPDRQPARPRRERRGVPR